MTVHCRRISMVVFMLVVGVVAGCGESAPRLYGTWEQEIPGGEVGREFATAFFGRNIITFTPTEMVTRTTSTKVRYEVDGNVIIVTARGESAAAALKLTLSPLST